MFHAKNPAPIRAENVGAKFRKREGRGDFLAFCPSAGKAGTNLAFNAGAVLFSNFPSAREEQKTMQRSLGPARILTYAAAAFATQALLKRGYRYYRKVQEENLKSAKTDLDEDSAPMDEVDIASIDSFPASDPPSFTTAGHIQ